MDIVGKLRFGDVIITAVSEAGNLVTCCRVVHRKYAEAICEKLMMASTTMKYEVVEIKVEVK